MIGNNSCGTHSLLAGKTVDNVHDAAGSALRRHRADRRPTTDAELDAIAREGGTARTRSTQRCDRSAIDSRIRFAAGFRRSRAVSPATTSISCFPKTASTSRGRWSEPKARAPSCWRRPLRLIESPRHRTLVGLGYPDAFAAADHVPAILDTASDRARRFRRRHRRRAAGTRARRTSTCCPRAAAFCWLNTDRTIPPKVPASADRLVEMLSRLVRRTGRTDLHGGRRPRRSGRFASRVRAPPSAVPGSLPRWEGWDDASVAPERLGPYLRDLRKLLNEYQIPGGVLRAFRPRLHPHAGQLRFRDGRRHPAVCRVRRSRSRPGDSLRRFSFRRAWRRAVARRAAAEDVRRRSSCARSPSSRRSGIRATG